MPPPRNHEETEDSFQNYRLMLMSRLDKLDEGQRELWAEIKQLAKDRAIAEEGIRAAISKTAADAKEGIATVDRTLANLSGRASGFGALAGGLASGLVSLISGWHR